MRSCQASLPNIGGVVDFFTGGNDLETFANGLLPFGEGMKAYADAVSGMDAGAVSASIIATQALAELQASLPHVGGVMSFFTGGNDLGLFAEGILSFGEAMNSYGNAVSGIDAGAVSASATAAQALSRLQASLPNVGGIMEFFTGGNDLGKFSEGIIPFGEAMKAYGESVAGIDSSAVEASATAAHSLAQLQAALPQVGGLMEFFTGGNDLGVFSEGIVPFGAAMKSYAEAVSGINADAVTASAVAAQALAQLQTDLPNVGGVMAFFNGGNDLGTFAAGHRTLRRGHEVLWGCRGRHQHRSHHRLGHCRPVSGAAARGPSPGRRCDGILQRMPGPGPLLRPGITPSARP